MSEPFLPYGKQDISDEDVEAVVKALRSSFLTTGPRVREFEQVFANYVGAAHAVAVANGTAALHLACLALDVQPGDVVLAPTMSFAASANGAAYCGAKIEFVDCDPDTGLITPQTFLEAADRAKSAGNSPKAGVIVHLNGEHADMAGIAAVAGERGIRLIEDSCHALGTRYSDHTGEMFKVGQCRYSDISTYSTHPVKTITKGEGGVITTQDPVLAKRLENLRSHGIERDPECFTQQELAFDSEGNPNPWYYEMQALGFNYRLTDIACALGTSQMARMEEIAARRRILKQLYDDELNGSNLPLKTIPTADNVDPVRHLYPILVNFEEWGMERSTFSRQLRELGIGTQVHYIPCHLQPYYKNNAVRLPGAESYYRRVISLPLYPTMADTDVGRVVNAVRQVLDNGKA